MNLPGTLRKLRSDKQWFDELIAAVEQWRRSKPFQAMAFLDLHLAQNGRFDHSAISGRKRRRLSRWLRSANGAARRSRGG